MREGHNRVVGHGSAMTYLLHRTVETGHCRESPRAEVDDGVLDALRPLLADALRTRRTVHLPPTAWRFQARELDGALRVLCWYGPQRDDQVQLVVDVRRGDPPECDAHVAGLLAQGDVVALGMAGDLERCIAWVWLEAGGVD